MAKPYSKMLKSELIDHLENQIKLNSALVSRSGLAQALGQSFSGERDLYTVLGYTKTPQFADYLNIYERDGLGTRVVDTVSDETWRKHPILLEEGQKSADELDEPTQLQKDFEELVDRLDLWAQFNEVDRSCGISRFGLIYLGLPGRPEDPVDKKSKDIMYVTTHDEGNARVDELSLVSDKTSPRFGLPTRYYISIDENESADLAVDYTRVIHVKEGRERAGMGKTGLGRIYGVPRLKKVLNRLYDLEKVTGGGSEAYYQLILRGMALMAKEGYTMPQKDSDEYKAMQDEIDEWFYGLRRYIRLQGMELQDLGGKPVDSREQFDVIVAYIAGSERIPQRILLGSERGNLASSQDDANFMDYIDWRRKNFAEPYILRPFIKRMGELGILNVPEKYNVHWPSLFELTDLEKADLAVKIAQAMNQASGGAPETIMPFDEFAKRYLDYEWPEGRIQAIQAWLGQGQGNQTQPPPPNGNDNQPVNIQDPKDIGNFPNNLISANSRINTSKIKQVLKRHDLGEPIWFKTRFGVTMMHNENENSAMIALRIPDVLREELQKEYPIMSDETRDDLHITLAFLGDYRTLNMQKVAWALADFTENARPIKTTLQGVARFVSGNETDPIVALFDSPEFPAFRQSLTDALDQHGIPYHREHGFIPHMTLAYVPKDDKTQVDVGQLLEMNFSEVHLVVGGQWIGFGLGEEFVGMGEEIVP